MSAKTTTEASAEGATRRIVGRIEPSERIIEIDFVDGKPVAASHR
jgi:hypothetical protein